METDPLDTNEASALLGVTRVTLRRLANEGLIAPIYQRKGGSTLYLRADVERLAAQRAANPPKRGPKPKAK